MAFWKQISWWAVLCVLAALPATHAFAAVGVLSNHTLATQSMKLVVDGGAERPFSLSSGDSRPVFFASSLRVRIGEGIDRREFVVAPQSANYFYADEFGSVRLERIGLGERDHEAIIPLTNPKPVLNEPVVIPVTIYVDDDEPTRQSVWRERLRTRVEAASKILEAHSGVRLEVKSFGEWESDDAQHDFTQALTEFTKSVASKPGELAIGFSSQFQLVQGRVHLGGTRGPLFPYILMKERAPNVLDTERLELLVHELGHFLGASHSPEPTSVMRPLLSGGLQRRVGARVQFDPVNTLLVAMMGEEMRDHGARRLSDVSIDTRRRMQEIYEVLEKTLPDDPAAGQFQNLLGLSQVPPLISATQGVLTGLMNQALREQAAEQAALEQGQPPLAGDVLTEHYVREAARTAQQLPGVDSTKAFLLALGVFFDDADALRKLPPTAAVVERVESELERSRRLKVLGNPTLRGRGDLAKHFFVSAHAVVVMGSKGARSIGLIKEMIDSQGGTGFSFADMAANRAGILFAEKLLSGQVSLEQLSEGFVVDDYMPSVAGLAEGLQGASLSLEFQNNQGINLNAELEKVEMRVKSLPVHSGRGRAEAAK